MVAPTTPPQPSPEPSSSFTDLPTNPAGFSSLQFQINGKQCRVSSVQDNDTIYLGNICKTWKLEALKDKLRHYGVRNFENLALVEDSNNEGMNRGFAILDFSSHSKARKAYTQLQKRDEFFINLNTVSWRNQLDSPVNS
ncbi:hypothetical protein HN51_003480 [Arachis hypogaea]|uniref:uncharacterized protein LOC110270506 n=1 Tax=Arachis ipaensis TaxID=130454 RepID=UPI000A2B5E7D|nr:uncharacterized protein LOC110270506 [Arachis ipaensis]XP_025644792.1 uncharacterized protein LOC112740224 [Arachis hypogaea]QHO05635.1 uncharacterized protein DS421_14g447870 [Arachis hypogaea]